MTKRILANFYYSAMVLVFFTATLVSAQPVSKTPPRNIFIIILNSVRYSDAFGDKRHLYIENIWEKIRPSGTLCRNIYNNSNTFPLPAQSVLLTGASCSGTTNSPQSSSLPTLFEYYRKQSGALKEKVLLVVSDSGLPVLACGKSAGYGSVYAPTILEKDTGNTDENAVYTNAAAYIKEHHPSLVVLSIATGKPSHNKMAEKACKVPSRGISDECEGEESINMYYEGIIQNDMIAMKVWEIAQTDEIYKDNTIFLVVSSQGRHTNDYKSYGDNCEGCRRLLFLIAGPGVRKNHISGKKRNLTDVLPTIGKLAGINTEQATGHFMNEVLTDK